MSELFRDLIEVYQIFATFSPLVQYFPQYFIMKENESVGSFSKSICFILILSSLLRVVFYVGHRYEFCLFTQAVFNIFVQFFLLKTYYFYERFSSGKGFLESRQIISERAKKDLKNALLAYLTIFTFYLFFFITYKSEFLIETTGMFSALIETTVPIPQFFSNYRNKSCHGLSKVMIMFWLLGDIARLAFFINREQPVQFSICSGIQILFDLSIIYQFYLY